MLRRLALLALLVCFGCPSNDDGALPAPTKRCRAPNAVVRDAGVRDGSPITDPDCDSCRQDGDSCDFSINCQVGSSCNVPGSPAHDPEIPEWICFRVRCATDEDCAAGQRCDGVLNACTRAACTNDDACMGGRVCAEGACLASLAASDADTCQITGVDAVVTRGTRVPLTGVAYTRCGEPLPEVSLEWNSDSAAVRVEGPFAVATNTAGAATITAHVGAVACDGARTIESLGEAPVGTTRVTVRAFGGAALPGIDVVVEEAGGSLDGTTDANGVVRFDREIDATRVSAIVPDGVPYDSMTVIAPDTRSIELTLNPATIVSSVRGARGGLAAQSLEQGDIAMGFVGTPLVPNAGDFDVAHSACGELIPTRINAPQLGLDTISDLPGGLIWGLANDQFTRNAERCGSTNPTMGCFAVQAREQEDTVWGVGSYARLSRVSAIANTISDALDTAEPSCDTFLPFLVVAQTVGSGSISGLSLDAAPRTGDPGVDCTDAAQADYTTACLPRFDRFVDTVVPVAPATSFGIVEVGAIPASPAGKCPLLTTVYGGRVTPEGRFIPSGFGGGLDADGDCQTDAATAGSTETPVPAGSVALFGSETKSPGILVISSQGLVPGGIGRASGAFLRPNAIGGVHTATLPGYPTGSIDAAAGSATITPPPGATHVELYFRRGDRGWSVWTTAANARAFGWGAVDGVNAQLYEDGARVSVRAATLSRAPWEGLRLGDEPMSFSSAWCEMRSGRCSTDP